MVQRIRLYLPIYAILLCLLILASFFDLRLSQELHDDYNSFARFLADYGECPIHFLMLSFLSLMSSHYLKRKNWWAFFPLLLIPVYIFLSLDFGIFIELIFVVLCYVIVVAGLFINYDPQFMHKLLIWLLFATAITIISGLCIEWIKIIWGRVRFRNLHDDFSHWFLPQGVTGNKSFPSGHVGAAGCLLSTVFLKRIFAIKCKLISISLIAVPAVWTILMAISRIIIGAHYLSDVTFSMCIIMTVILIFDAKYKSIFSFFTKLVK